MFACPVTRFYEPDPPKPVPNSIRRVGGMGHWSAIGQRLRITHVIIVSYTDLSGQVTYSEEQHLPWHRPPSKDGEPSTYPLPVWRPP